MTHSYRQYDRTFQCSDSMCGADDCSVCRPGCNGEQETVRDLSDAGFDFHPEDQWWSKVVEFRVCTARRDHTKRDIKKGDRYSRWTTRFVEDETGHSSHSNVYRILARAQVAA